ncbi:MAG: glycosyltransferase family 1 protein [Cyclobacteriaceae bacterium]
MSQLNGLVINCRFLTQEINGVQKFAFEICQVIKKKCPEVIFVAPNASLNVHGEKILQPEKIGFLKGHLWEQIELPIFLRVRKLDFLLNLANTGPIFWKKSFVTIHDLAFMEDKRWFNPNFRRWYNFLIPRIAYRSLRIFTVSNFSKSELSTKLGIPMKKIAVIYNAVNLKINGEQEDKVKGRILTVGSINPRKNLQVLLKAFRSFETKYELVIIGGKSEVFGKSEAGEEGTNVSYMGYVDDYLLSYYYRTSELFVYPSLYEGFGIPPLEAMSQGCPVLLSNIPAHKEIYEGSAQFFDPASVKSLIEGIQHFFEMSDLAKTKMILNSKNRANEFTWEASANLILNSVETCMK